MEPSRDLQSVFAEAEQAAGAGDYHTAEQLLLEAAAQQESTLGPFHPDLANTINNLAVVYETLDRPADAERCYRRAYSIAIATLPADHPFVATSEKNYREFCESRGITFEPPKPLPPAEPVPAPPEVQLASDVHPTREVRAEPDIELTEQVEPAANIAPDIDVAPQSEGQPTDPLAKENPSANANRAAPVQPVLVQPSEEPRESRPAAVPLPPPAASSRSRSFPMAAAGLLGLALIVATVMWLGADRDVESRSPVTMDKMGAPSNPALEPVTAATKSQDTSAVGTAVPTKVESPAASAVEASVKTGVERSARGNVETPEPVANRSAPSASSRLTVEANLCRELSSRDWRCNAAGRSVDSGLLFFYTRIKSPDSLTVEHRWYRNDRLHRRVALRVQSNEQSGFRTYSRTAVEQGDWRVELRTRDGALLHTENFVVR
jgi:hypothetical protein